MSFACPLCMGDSSGSFRPVVFNFASHRSPITDHQSPTVLTSLFLRIYYISFEKRLHFDFFSFAICIDFTIKMKKCIEFIDTFITTKN